MRCCGCCLVVVVVIVVVCLLELEPLDMEMILCRFCFSPEPLMS